MKGMLFLTGFIIFLISSQLFAGTELWQLLQSAERHPQQLRLAKQTAIGKNLPLSIYLPQGIFIYAADVENGQPIYAVITNMAHPEQGGTTATFDELHQNYDLSNARIYYGRGRIINDVPGAGRKLESADSLLLVPDWSGDRVLAFDPATGDLLDANYVPSNPSLLASPKEARQTPWGTISVSDQIQDLVQEFDADGNFLRTLAPAGGVNNSIMDNVRGHAYNPAGNLVVTVAGGANDDAIAEFDSAGNYLGNFIANGAGGLNGPYDILFRSADVLVTASTSDAIHRYDLNGNFLDNLVTGLAFPQQIIELANGDLAVANFSGNTGILIYSATGAFIRGLYGISSPRGMWPLGNGNFLATNGAGVHELDGASGNLVRTVYAGVSAQYVGLLVKQQPLPARVQLIQNCADPALDSLDFYIDDSLFVDNFKFRTATPFMDFPALSPFVLGIAPGNSNSVNDTLTSEMVELDPGYTYVAAIGGVVDTTQFLPNPDGRDIDLTTFGMDSAREVGIGSDVDLLFFHGVTDMAGFDIRIRNGATLANNLFFGDFSNYVSITPGQYLLDITADTSGGPSGYAFVAELDSLGGQPVVMVASGFLNPTQNQNGEPLQLMAVLPDGHTTLLAHEPIGIKPGSTPIAEQFELLPNYPNPFNPSTTIRFRLPHTGPVEVRIINPVGQTVRTLMNSRQSAGLHEIRWDGTNDAGNPVASGIYLLQVKANSGLRQQKLLLLK